LGLGQYLVHELGEEDGVGILGRWMAHYIAELMVAAEKEESTKERAKAKKLAMDTILKIWEKRASLPGNAYPLNSYREVAKIVEILRPESNPVRVVIVGEKKSALQLVGELFDSLTRLIVGVLLIEASSIRLPKKRIDAYSFAALSTNEKSVILALDRWIEMLQIQYGNGTVKAHTTNKKTVPKTEIKETLLDLMKKASEDLSALRNVLEDQEDAKKRKRSQTVQKLRQN